MRVRPIVTTASVGMASAGSCVVGSITRSGRSTTQPVATTSTSRAIAARPGQPASSRSSHVPGLSPLPSDSSFTAAVRAMTYSSVPANARIHTERRNRTARMYSGPSGQATTISTNEPNRMARPSVDRTRPSHVAPSDTSAASCTVDALDAAVAAADLGRRGVVAAGVGAPSRRRAVRRRVVGRGVGDASTSKLNEPRGAVLAVRLQRRPAHVAGAGGHRHEDRHGERLAVGALRRSGRRSAVRTGC